MNALNKYGWVFAIAALLLLALLLMMPKPTAEGSCAVSCTSHQVGAMDYEMDAVDICGAGCLIDRIEVGIQHPWLVTCKCCQCVGDAMLALPPCGGSPLGPVYRVLGVCV